MHRVIRGQAGPLMECGHSADADQDTPWIGAGTTRPVCSVCWPRESSLEVAGTRTPRPELAGRTARCSCGHVAPSDPRLFGFEYRGPGSPHALSVCTCGYYETAHGLDGCKACDHFTPIGPAELDSFYCGCRGWD